MKVNDNSTFRESVILSGNYDIVALCETFLRNDEKIDIQGYKWIGHNRCDIGKMRNEGQVV